MRIPNLGSAHDWRSKDLLEAHVDEIRQQPTIAGFTIKVTPLEELADGRFHLQVVIQFGQLIQLLVVPSGQADGGVVAQTTAQFNVRRRYEVGQERPEDCEHLEALEEEEKVPSLAFSFRAESELS
ncbi:hypothetical protein TYRP_016673 [Tyrophagus putrescentiae]|nr:hypothetical protein TYRP_016673 [Tyrophagus putrescentiae]